MYPSFIKGMLCKTQTLRVFLAEELGGLWLHNVSTELLY